MGLGPKNSSLLHKLGFKQAWEMTDVELQSIVAKDQHRRTIDRAVARLERVLADDDGETYTPKRAGRPRTKSTVKTSTPRRKKTSSGENKRLEELGLPSDLISKLRQTGKPDFQLILELQAAGMI